MGAVTHEWRPSRFRPVVVHLAAEGQTPRTSRDYLGVQWVRAECSQKVAPDGDETSDSIRCPECLLWLEHQG